MQRAWGIPSEMSEADAQSTWEITLPLPLPFVMSMRWSKQSDTAMRVEATKNNGERSYRVPTS